MSDPKSPELIDFQFPGGNTRAAFATAPFAGLGAQVSALRGVDRCVVISDDVVNGLHGRALLDALRGAGLEPELFSVPAGDQHKTLDSLERLFDCMQRVNADRHTAVVGIGGGMIGDLAGLVAALWMRGIPYVSCPTTLLAMVDACLGGKVGVNFARTKNLIGAFYHAQLVWLDMAFLASLPARVRIAGLAESVKHAVLLDRPFLDWHEVHADALGKGDPATLRVLVERNLRLKAAVVAADERECPVQPGTGRAALNFGHTIGHILETLASGEDHNACWMHGECVSVGMVAAMELAVRAGRLSDADRRRVESVLVKLGLPTRTPVRFDPNVVIARLPTDKKARRDRARFVIPDGLGRATWLEHPSEADLRAALDRIQAG